MITISVIGLDQYVVGHYSKQHSKNLAALFETSEDNISFIAPDCYIFHNGVEQTSWNSIVRVTAPRQFEKLEANVAKYLLKTLNCDEETKLKYYKELIKVMSRNRKFKERCEEITSFEEKIKIIEIYKNIRKER